MVLLQELKIVATLGKAHQCLLSMPSTNNLMLSGMDRGSVKSWKRQSWASLILKSKIWKGQKSEVDRGIRMPSKHSDLALAGLEMLNQWRLSQHSWFWRSLESAHLLPWAVWTEGAPPLMHYHTSVSSYHRQHIFQSILLPSLISSLERKVELRSL